MSAVRKVQDGNDLILATSSFNAIESLVAILVLASVHLFVNALERISTRARYALLSAAAGASLAYVMLRILPKLAEKQESLVAGLDAGVRGFLEHHAYLVAMAGLLLYYGMSRVAAYGAAGATHQASHSYLAALLATVFGQAAYSLLIGYLIVNRVRFGLVSFVLITVGMGMLFMLSDHGLRKKWPDLYDGWIRWVLTAALLAGWAVGVWVDVSDNTVALWYAFLGGIMLITTIGEKVSMPESGFFWYFLLGVIGLTALLLMLEQMPQSIV